MIKLQSHRPRMLRYPSFLQRLPKQLPRIPFWFFQEYFRQAWKLHHTLQSLLQTQVPYRMQARSCHRNNYLPENFSLRHSQRSPRINHIYINLFKCCSCISIHKRKCDDKCCDNTARPGLNHFNIKLCV